MRDLLPGLLAALLPDPERGDFSRRYGGDPAAWSLFLGLVEFLGGGLVMVSNGIGFFQRVAERNARMFVDVVESAAMSREELRGYMLSGVANWLDWLAQPWTWLLFLIPATGLLRLVVYGINHEAAGEPLVWAGLRLWQVVQRKLGQSRDLLRYGPERPDRIVPSPGGLTVLACRPKPDWNPLVTIEIRERFYHLLRTEERQDGQWWVYAYVMREMPESDVIRYLIRYEAPHGRTRTGTD